MCHGLAGALAYLHSRGVSHGDFYAHNIMLEGGSGHAVLCDFGAAFCYDREAAGGFWEAMEVRAFGLFMQGLVEHVRDSSDGSDGSSEQRQQRLREVLAACLAARGADRPTCAQLEQQLSALL
jgi:tRNA A-37 threonylcarbamoyl transferase component Bud32